MAAQALPDEVRELADRLLTQAQIDALVLYELGCGYGRVASLLGVSTPSARDRIHRGLMALEPHAPNLSDMSERRRPRSVMPPPPS
jgi:hypothetical protein